MGLVSTRISKVLPIVKGEESWGPVRSICSNGSTVSLRSNRLPASVTAGLIPRSLLRKELFPDLLEFVILIAMF